MEITNEQTHVSHDVHFHASKRVIEHVKREVLTRAPPDRLGWLVTGGEFVSDRQFTEIASSMVSAIGNELVH
jgi:hypothetical protein